jgi:hypothetical protein
MYHTHVYYSERSGEYTALSDPYPLMLARHFLPNVCVQEVRRVPQFIFWENLDFIQRARMKWLKIAKVKEQTYRFRVDEDNRRGHRVG